MKRERGLTLVEVLVVVAILVLMVGIATGSLNPLSLINKGKDARRKKDLTRIKVAMEDYWTDKGCFPSGAVLTGLNDVMNCSSGVFSPWLDIWPCDRDRTTPYYLLTEDIACPSWFKVLVYLDNTKDTDIPDWWYDHSPGAYCVGDGSYCNDQINFGVSSTNVLWYERVLDPYCLGGGNTGECHTRPGGVGTCQSSADSGTSCADDSDNCFLDYNCLNQCKVTCCNDGQPC